MHLLPVTTVSLDEGAEAVDLRQPPGDVVALSFADSDLSALAAAREALPPGAPSLRLASLRRLRHPLSVDLYVEGTAARARFVLVRCLGGLDYWRYGLERLHAACRANGVTLAVLPGDDRPDPRLPDYATVPAAFCDELEAYFRAGGVENMGRLLARIAAEIGMEGGPVLPPRTVPRAFAWTPEGGPDDAVQVLAGLDPARPLAHLLVYRSSLLAGDTATAGALCEALQARGIEPLVLAVSSLKDPAAVSVVAEAAAARRPDIVLTTTAFAARDDSGFVLDAAACPVLQVIPVGVSREAWEASPRGLSAADLAMQVALPEFDGRIGAGPISFKAEAEPDPALAFARRVQAPDLEGVVAAADLAAAWVRLARTPRPERRMALVLSDYPARGGRAGFAVGLDTPASVSAILGTLADAGYDVTRDIDPADLMPRLMGAAPSLAVPLGAYRAWLDTLGEPQRAELHARWGAPEADPAFQESAFHFRSLKAGRVLVALQPDRGHGGDRKARYHDGDLPPCHGYLAFYLALRGLERVDALIHLGTHGTTEWLPGKAVALSAACWPRLATGSLPVVYPFIVDDPGEAAPAKRRLGAVTLGHLTPAVMETGLQGEAAALRELVEEYSQAGVLDPRRAELVAAEIRERARASGLDRACGVDEGTPMDEALTRLDAHLCDLGETTARDGLHVFGQARPGFQACGEAERAGLLAALDGRFVPPGPAGSPSRGRLDVLPTGRNLATLDPRAIPTRAATELGRRAAAEVVRRHLQEEGDWPRRVVMDLWASPTLRSGGEDIAHAMALMGVRPVWDHASTRVTGFEIVPQPLLEGPRADVTIRVSGAFRDAFPEQIALLDAAARAVAALNEDDEWNEPAAARRRGESAARIFGGAPGTYGAGVSARALDGDWSGRGDLGQTYLASVTHAYGAGGEARADASFPERVGGAQAFVHVTDVAERDILDGDAVADAFGGFAAAAEALGACPALYSLDTSRPDSMRARTLREDVDRLVRGRLSHPRWIEGQLRHGWRGAAEIAQGVDALYAFAATTREVGDAAFDLVFTALIGDESVRDRLAQANPAAAHAIRERLADARRRGLWTSRLNSVAACLDDVLPEAAE
ncbi:cobaltochelatase subunit CobN [Salinarimonas soli]|uniref:Cobaltochelatase subunit CobN n=1 Tax=Salinarimonas soli TaxID=1638099 RepID=A0A5B2VVW5_9HYPH|nr:cobaltochelatase subunit CobN [Salinarimonas soli]KAA2242306.1 cobaltochelatase subunit CobN [Salinarimonas soli]